MPIYNIKTTLFGFTEFTWQSFNIDTHSRSVNFWEWTCDQKLLNSHDHCVGDDVIAVLHHGCGCTVDFTLKQVVAALPECCIPGC